MNNTNYQSFQVKLEYQYVQRILHKYHKVSEFLDLTYNHNQAIDSQNYQTFVEELKSLESLSPGGIIRLNKYPAITINVFGKLDEQGNTKILDVLDFSECNETELACIETLTVIVHKYCSHDYQHSFAQHWGENMSDKESNDYDNTFLHHSYAVLKDLKNLLLFKKNGFVDNTITINHTEEREIENGQKKNYILKDNQVSVSDPITMAKLIDVLIEEKLDQICTVPNNYINSLKLSQYTLDTISYESILAEYESISAMLAKPVKGKLPSKKAVFKGLISKLVKQYVVAEGLTFAEKIVDERQAQLLAYKLLASFGFISLDLINSHRDRDARIKYMDSLPYWKGDPILPNLMKIIPHEEMLKNYSPS